MRAAFLHGAADLRLAELPLPVVGGQQVLVRVAACGVCGGDYKAYHTPGLQLAQPTIGGHEVAGWVAAAGSDVAGFTLGQRIAVSPDTPCGHCWACERGLHQLCADKVRRGPSYGGGFAEYWVVDQRQCHPIPDNLSLTEAAVAEPLACCLHSMERVGVAPGDRVLIMGGGANAQLFVQLARLKGAASVVLTDSVPARLALARQLGADAALDPTDADRFTVCNGAQPGPDVVLVTRGSPEALAAAVRWVAPGGRVLCYGVAAAGVTAAIEPHLLWRKEVTLIGARGYRHTFGRALALLGAGRIQVAPLVTRCIDLAELDEALREQSLQQIKTLVTFRQPGETE